MGRTDMTAGCVVIGRNEAARLPAALASVTAADLPMVYVDSGSHDASVEIATTAGALLVALDAGRPFTAARARNEGLDALVDAHPDLDYVMFLDGDCRLESGFVPAAVATMAANADCAVVIGHLHEEQTTPSIYTRLSAIEWSSGVGEIRDFNDMGGIMFGRIADIRSVGGFNAAMIAGEDPELGVRLALGGRRVLKIDAPMATHRADIVRFGQWWKRAVRAGQALTHRYHLHGKSPLHDCRRQYWSTLIWGGAVPIAAVTFVPVSRGLSLLLLGAYAALMVRMTLHFRRAGEPAALALAAASFGIIGKVANFLGLLRFYIYNTRGRVVLVEYK